MIFYNQTAFIKTNDFFFGVKLTEQEKSDTNKKWFTFGIDSTRELAPQPEQGKPINEYFTHTKKYSVQCTISRIINFKIKI